MDSVPLIRLRSVDFPAPFGPTIPNASPLLTSKEMPSATTTRPNLLLRSDTFKSCALTITFLDD